jgi:hypothetical protein
MDFQSPGFRRTFPKVVLALCAAGLLLILISVILVAVGYSPAD